MGCIDNGTLSGGTVEASPAVACVGDTITFTGSGVGDNGGIQRVDCTAKTFIPPVAPTYTWTLTLPADYPPPLPPLSGSGSSVSVVAKVPGTYSASFTATADRDCPPPPITVGSASVSTAELVSVHWTEFAPESTPLDTCPNNGGNRIFPGRRFAADPFSTIRRKVSMEAAVSPIKEGCTVYFRTFDVDDPFDQNNPTMANVSIIDNDTSGPDNRPLGQVDSGVGQWSATTDVDGRARVTVTVSMQPGNNYRAAASSSHRSSSPDCARRCAPQSTRAFKRDRQSSGLSAVRPGDLRFPLLVALRKARVAGCLPPHARMTRSTMLRWDGDAVTP